MPPLNRRHDMLLTIDVTGRCNLKCTTCYNAEFLHDSPSGEDLKLLVKRIPSKWSLYFLGGEPLLRDDFLELVQLSKQFGHDTSFSTNGQLIEKRGADAIISTGVDTIYISLDGPTAQINDLIRGHGSFERCMRGIELLNESIERLRMPTKICISVTAISSNLDALSGMPRLLHERGLYVEKLGIVPVSLSGRAANEPQMAIRAQAWLELCEALCSEWRTFPSLCFLCLPNPELLVRYLETRFDLLLPESIADCPVVQERDVGRVLANGDVVPCSGRLHLLRQYEIAHHGDGKRPLPQFIDDHQMFQQFIGDMRSHVHLGMPVCEGCAFAAHCQVCPLENKAMGDGRQARADLCTATLHRIVGPTDMPVWEQHQRAMSRAPAGEPYIKHRRFGERMLFAPASRRIICVEGIEAQALELLIEKRQASSTISTLLANGVSPGAAVEATRLTIDALHKGVPTLRLVS